MFGRKKGTGNTAENPELTFRIRKGISKPLG
jgi:hypothetical protein